MTHFVSRLRSTILTGYTPSLTVNAPSTNHVPLYSALSRFASEPPSIKVNCLVRTGLFDEARYEFDRIARRDLETWNSTLSWYVKHGEIRKARKVFDEMPDRDVVTWNLLICGYISSNSAYSIEEARKLFDEMPVRDSFSWNAMISGYAKRGKMSDALWLFIRMRRRNVVTWNSMLSGYVKLREIGNARKVFDEIPERDVVSWNLMISGYMSCHRADYVAVARKLFEVMPEKDSCSWNTMISGYAKNGKMSDALRLFNRIPDRDPISWNAVITGFLQNGDCESALRLFHAMPEKQGDSLCALVSGLIRNGRLNEAARVLFASSRAYRAADLVYAYNTLIAGYGREGRVEEARRVFDSIPFYRDKTTDRFERNSVSWNSMIMCYLRARDVGSARSLFDQIPDADRDAFSWNTMITGYVAESNMRFAYELFSRMPCPDTLTWNSMVSGFAKIGDLGFARQLFDATPQKHLVSWNSMLAGYEQNKDYEASVSLFARMRSEAVKHDCHTLSTVLSACTGLLDLRLGTQLHQLLIKTQAPDVVTRNSVITMYARCGVIGGARAAFDEAGPAGRDVISWNAMIGGYAAHGQPAEALELFGAMLTTTRSGAGPTGVTFVAALTACSGAGLVEEGKRIFGAMERGFGVVPGPDHYACLVGLVGRHGSLEEVAEIVGSMPVRPDGSVWGALLGACRARGDVRIARLAAEALMRAEPRSTAPYVLLYNIYADLGLWDDAAKVRMIMEEKNLVKERGFSSFDFSFGSSW